MTKPSPWSRYVDSAVHGSRAAGRSKGWNGGPEGAATTRGHHQAHKTRGADAIAESFRRKGGRLRSFCATQSARAGASRRKSEQQSGTGETSRRRTDVRLALPAALAWGAAMAGLWLEPLALAVLCCALLVAAAVLLHRTMASASRQGRISSRRSSLATVAVSLLVACIVAAHSAVGSIQRHEGPLAAAIAAGSSAVAVVEITGTPRALAAPGQAGPPERWSVPVRAMEVTAGGVLLLTKADLMVMGGGAWGAVGPGQLVRAAGKLKPSAPGRSEAGILSASSQPGRVTGIPLLEGAAKDLREGFVAAAAFLAPDPRGLLPGMVTGDTSALDEGLDSAMKNVGMTHLTAVSGANCSLVLGALLLLCRRFHLPRVPAAVLAITGLGLFVLLVGPDASVLRAALMGGVAVASLAGGRPGRGLSFLCLAVIGLLLLDPSLGSSFGFLLSVLATLGIIILGQWMVNWAPRLIPRWAAGAIAVPLSAQMFCGPVIVLLQPGFSTYSLLANVLAAPLVAPVTLLGTAAVPLVVLLPPAATALIGVAGTFSAGVAATARFTSQLPGASLPWPEGVPGAATMFLFSLLTFGLSWAAARPHRLLHHVLAVHRGTVAAIALMEVRAAAAARGPARWPGSQEPTLRRRRRTGSGLDRRPGHGRLGISTNRPERMPRWPLRRDVPPVRRRRTAPPGGT